MDIFHIINKNPEMHLAVNKAQEFPIIYNVDR